MESLPDEILEQIFELLPPPTLQTLLRNSAPRYHDLIAKSSKMMGKVTVTTFHGKRMKNGFNEGIVRKLKTYGQLTKTHIQKFCQTQKLVLTDTTRQNFQRNLNLLSEVSMVEIRTSNYREMPVNIKLEEKVLQEVEIKCMDADFFDANTQIIKLTVNYFLHNSPPAMVDDSTYKLLLVQNLLTSLILRHCNCNQHREIDGIFATDVSDQYKFRLKHFEMIFFISVASSIENMTKFMKSQTELTSLNLNGPIGPKLWQAIVELPLLQKLEFNQKCFQSSSFNDRLTRNLKVTELTLSGKFSNEIFERILSHFPNLVKFVQANWFTTSQTQLITISEMLPLLETLHVRLFEGAVTFDGHAFKNLKQIKIDAFNLNHTNSEYWNNFVKMFSGIQKITIMQGVPGITFPFDVMLTFLSGMKSLHCLELGSNLVDDLILQVIR